ncbi:MAG TPA: acylphosphatase [Candidatus Saccharimonadia bacterium]|jgi:acylphosphatase
MKRLCITVTGRVQGVFFRDTARRTASSLGLAGFARNQPDGSVHIEIEGPQPALEQFLAWCHNGSPHAHVEAVVYTVHRPAGHRGFTIG